MGEAMSKKYSTQSIQWHKLYSQHNERSIRWVRKKLKLNEASNGASLRHGTLTTGRRRSRERLKRSGAAGKLCDHLWGGSDTVVAPQRLPSRQVRRTPPSQSRKSTTSLQERTIWVIKAISLSREHIFLFLFLLRSQNKDRTLITEETGASRRQIDGI